MKKRTKIIWAIAAIIAICVICLLLRFYFSTSPYTKVIKSNWDIELPNDAAREVYSYSTPSPHGDGIRYHVIDYPVGNESKKVQNAVFQLEKVFNHAPQPTESQIAYVSQMLNEINVKDDVIPDWGKCRLIYLKQNDNSELFLFYWSETGTVYVVESFV